MLTVETWIECLEILADKDLEPARQVLNIISVRLDKSIEEIENSDWDDIAKYAELTWLQPEPQEPVLKLNGNEYRPIKFTKLEFGAFIDIEAIFSNDLHVHLLDKMIGILFRRVTKSDRIGEEYNYAEYHGTNEELLRLIRQQEVAKVEKVIVDYTVWRNGLLNTYQGLFEEGGDDEDLDLTGLTMKERQEIENAAKTKKWGWELFLFKLSGNNPLLLEDATKLPVISALNTLSMIQELKIK